MRSKHTNHVFMICAATIQGQPQFDNFAQLQRLFRAATIRGAAVIRVNTVVAR